MNATTPPQALLVIDVQQALFDPPPFEAREVIERINALAAQCFDALRKLGDAFAATAVDADCHVRIAGLLKESGYLRQKLRRQVVDAIVGGVFKHIERNALAGA